MALYVKMMLGCMCGTVYQEISISYVFDALKLIICVLDNFSISKRTISKRGSLGRGFHILEWLRVSRYCQQRNAEASYNFLIYEENEKHISQDNIPGYTWLYWLFVESEPIMNSLL